jgi:hypothetical protein
VAEGGSPEPPLVQEARRLIDEARARGLRLRALGGTAVVMTIGGDALLERLGRGPLNDIDLAGASEERTQYRRLFDELGYEVDRALLVSAEGRRYGFRSRSDPSVHVDLFVDRFRMCHELDLRSRLDLGTYSLPAADLLLQKLQVVDLTRKDLVDVVALLIVAEPALDLRHVAATLADDWGLYHTALTTLGRVTDSLPEMGLSEAEGAAVGSASERLRAAVEQEPKSRRWRLRATIGTRRRWYQEVDEDTETF